MQYGQIEIDGKIYDFSAYPVGSIYMSVNSTSPASIFGGTWERLKDRFLLGAGDSYSAGATGGSSTVTLTKEQLPEHEHSVGTHLMALQTYVGTYEQNTENGTFAAVLTGKHQYSTLPDNKQGRLYAIDTVETRGEAHNNMPPYLTVYMWKRTA